MASLTRDGSLAGPGGTFGAPELSTNGRYIAFDHKASNLVAGDTNGASDVFIRDTQGVPEDPGTIPVVVGAGDVLVHEGDSGTRSAVFTVSLSEPVDSTVLVNYGTRDGSATSPKDYTAKAGTLSFAPGTVDMKVKVAVVGDTEDDAINTGVGTQGFILDLWGVSGPAVIGDFDAFGLIRDDDPPTVTGRGLAIGDVSIYEGDSDTRTAVFNVSLTVPSNKDITVNYATVKGTAVKPADYLGLSGTLRFGPGVTSLPIKVVVNGESVDEGAPERFFVKLSNVTAGAAGAKITDDTGQGTIIDDD